MGLEEIKTDEEFATAINKHERKEKEAVLVDFFADWCAPCRVINPALKKFSEKPEFNEVDFVKVNIDNLSSLSTKYGIHAIPTFMMFKGGEVMDGMKVVGADSRAVERMLAKAVGEIKANMKVADVKVADAKVEAEIKAELGSCEADSACK